MNSKPLSLNEIDIEQHEENKENSKDKGNLNGLLHSPFGLHCIVQVTRIIRNSKNKLAGRNDDNKILSIKVTLSIKSAVR